MEKLRLDFAKSKGYVVALGDELKHKDGENRLISGCNIATWVNNDSADKEWFITSFAVRENKGKQPVPDDFPVRLNLDVGEFSRGCAGDLIWTRTSPMLTKSTWKPDYNRLLKMQAEHDKHNESIIKACDEANKKESEIIYTQEMKDKGELPKVGMKCEVKYNGGNTFRNAIIKFISDYGIVHADMDTGVEIFCGSIESVDIHPPRTQQEIDLEEAKKKQIDLITNEIMLWSNVGYEYASLTAIKMQENGHLAEVVLSDLSSRGMGKV